MKSLLKLPNYPFRVEFEIIHSCNLNCAYCYAKPFTHTNPSIENLEYLFKKTKQEANPFQVILLGGEPFLRNDIIEVFELASKIFSNLRLGVSTNGTLISYLKPEKLVRLRELAIENKIGIQISLDSINPEVNDKVRGKTIDVLKALDTLESNGIFFSVGIVLTKINHLDILNTVEYLLKRYKYLTIINLENLEPSYSLGNKYFELHINSGEHKEIYRRIKELRGQLNRDDVKLDGIDEEDTKYSQFLFSTYEFTTCTAGLFRSAVLANGDITGCTMIRNVVLGNLYRESWKKIWERSKASFLALQNKVVGGQCYYYNLASNDKLYKLK
jgi:MoaA/NifB/PqqE/SkfB family radical SAM enzyme